MVVRRFSLLLGSETLASCVVCGQIARKLFEADPMLRQQFTIVFSSRWTSAGKCFCLQLTMIWDLSPESSQVMKRMFCADKFPKTFRFFDDFRIKHDPIFVQSKVLLICFHCSNRWQFFYFLLCPRNPFCRFYAIAFHHRLIVMKKNSTKRLIVAKDNCKRTFSGILLHLR